MLQIEKMMKLIQDKHNKYFYEHISNHEVMYTQEFKWRLRKIRDDGSYGGIWVPFTIDNAVDIFNKYQLHLFQFQLDLCRSLMSAAAYHDIMLKDLRKKLGNKTVDQAIKDTENFGKALAGMVDNITRKKTIKLVDND